MNIIWIIVGFMGGVIMAKNSAEMTAPAVSAVIVAMIVGCGIAWTAAYHGKRQAVASAVATAVAQATANARSEAAAQAAAVVNFYHEQSPERSILPGVHVADTQSIRNTDTQGEIAHGQDHAQDRGMEYRRGLSVRPLRRERGRSRR